MFISMCQNHRALVDAYKKGNFVVEANLSLRNKETLKMLIKSSCKDILRVIVKKGNWFENFRKDNAKFKINHPQVNELKALFHEIKDITNERLLITPHEQNEKLEYLKELLVREKVNNDLVKKLKEEQSLALADKDKDVSWVEFNSSGDRKKGQDGSIIIMWNNLGNLHFHI